MTPEFDSIGKYIYYFSHLEGALRLVVQDLLDLSQLQYEGLMPVIDFVSLCNVCKAQIPDKLEAERISRGLDLINRALKSNEDRVRVAHGRWAPYPWTASLEHASKSTFKRKTYFADPGELDRKANELHELFDEIWEFFLAVR